MLSDVTDVVGLDRFFKLCAEALDAVGAPSPAATEGLHGVFELAEDGALAGAFRGAGLVEVVQREHAFAMRLSGVAPEQLLTFQAENSAVPVICSIGRGSTPSCFIGTSR